MKYLAHYAYPIAAGTMVFAGMLGALGLLIASDDSSHRPTLLFATGIVLGVVAILISVLKAAAELSAQPPLRRRNPGLLIEDPELEAEMWRELRRRAPLASRSRAEAAKKLENLRSRG